MEDQAPSRQIQMRQETLSHTVKAKLFEYCTNITK